MFIIFCIQNCDCAFLQIFNTLNIHKIKLISSEELDLLKYLVFNYRIM